MSLQGQIAAANLAKDFIIQAMNHVQAASIDVDEAIAAMNQVGMEIGVVTAFNRTRSVGNELTQLLSMLESAREHLNTWLGAQ